MGYLFNIFTKKLDKTGINSIQAGSGISVDTTDPNNPVISSNGSNIAVVTNYAALPAPATVSGKFYWVSNATGTSWLPGSLGGTYRNSGLYYSNGTTWEFLNVPYQATQAAVNAGTITDQFVTPATLSNSTQWTTKEDVVNKKNVTSLSPNTTDYYSTQGIEDRLNQILNPIFFDDFTNFLLWRASAVNGGLPASSPEILGEVGVSLLGTGSSSVTGSYTLVRGTSAANGTQIGLYDIEFGAKVKIPILSNTTDEYLVSIGYTNANLGSISASANCAFFYDRVNDGDFWSVQTRNSSTTTKTVTSIAITANTQYKFKCVINATGTQILFYIAVGAAGLFILVATHTTNIPVFLMSASISIVKSVGTTNRNLSIDYWYNKSSNTSRTI